MFTNTILQRIRRVAPYLTSDDADAMLKRRARGLCFIALADSEVDDPSPRTEARRAAAEKPGAQARSGDPAREKKPAFRAVAVRYQVANVERSIAFYTRHLAFRLEQQSGTAFAKVSNGNLVLYLSGPKILGSRPLPDGRRQEPGGWNRLVLEVDDLASCVAAMSERAPFPERKKSRRGRGASRGGGGGKTLTETRSSCSSRPLSPSAGSPASTQTVDSS